ncbi:MAG: NifU family protein [bacterium]
MTEPNENIELAREAEPAPTESSTDSGAELAEEERSAAIEAAVDERVREFLARDGGGLEVVEIEDNRVPVSYQGACGGCASSSSGTLMVIQNALTIALNHDIEGVPV